jgi:L-ascorbate oxidase
LHQRTGHDAKLAGRTVGNLSRAERHRGPPPAGATATLKMIGLTMGFGDQWPAIDLAATSSRKAARAKSTTHALDIQGDARASMQSAGIFSVPVPKATATALPAGCMALPPGHRRRIFFGFEDVFTNNTFGLGYEEVDQRGNVVPGTQRPVARFDPSQNIVCLPLGPGQTPVYETWELVQLSTENHNFHVHQARFRIADASAASPLAMAVNASNAGGIIQDNLPLGVPLGVAVANIPQVADTQNGVCTIAQRRSGQRTSTPCWTFRSRSWVNSSTIATSSNTRTGA